MVLIIELIDFGILLIGDLIFPIWVQEIAIVVFGGISLYLAYDRARLMYRDRRKSKIK